MDVTLREITAETVRRITALSVSAEQQRFVASNAVSLAEALFHPEAWYRAIYLGDAPAGFVMLYDETLRAAPPAEPVIALWRFMVDARFHGQGVGKAALTQVIDHVRGKQVVSSLRTSFVPGPGCPEPFYLGFGFRPTGEIDDGEVVLELAWSADGLRRPSPIMSFDELVESAWNDHADRPEEVSGRLADALTRPESAADAAAYVQLVVHVYGEHLGRWRSGTALLESVGRNARWAGNPVVVGAVARGIAVLRYAGGDAAALEGLAAGDRTAVLATAASALVGRDEFGRAIAAYIEATSLAEAGLPSDAPAIRALAVGGNNLAAALEEKAHRDARETEAMLAAARAALRYWTRCGTWLEEERAEYRLARSLLRAGDGEGAVESALRCVDVCAKNEAPPLEQFFGHAVLALAQCALGDDRAYAASRKQALDCFALVGPSESPRCESELRELGG